MAKMGIGYYGTFAFLAPEEFELLNLWVLLRRTSKRKFYNIGLKEDIKRNPQLHAILKKTVEAIEKEERGKDKLTK